MPNILYNGPTSPFGRMTSVVIHETGAPIEEQAVDVYTASFIDPINPLRQIPTLVLDDGAAIYDSRVICRYVDSLSAHSLMGGEHRWEVETRWALAIGIMEAGLQRRMEILRSDGERSAEVIATREARIDRAIAHLEQAAPILPRDLPRIDAIAIAVALEYTDFRYTRDWREHCPRLADWLAHYGERPSLAQTRPRDPPSRSSKMAQVEIQSPLPGTFYRKPSPEAPTFKQEGDSVAVGDVVGLVEVMKQFSEVQSEVAGRIVRFLVDNDAPVEPGQALAVVEIA